MVESKEKTTLEKINEWSPSIILGGATTLKTAGSLMESAEYERWGDYNFDAFTRAADILDASAATTEAQYGRLARKLRGTQIANAAAQGRRISGSVVDVAADAAAQAALEKKIKVANLKNKAASARAKASNARAQAQAGALQSNIKAGANFITGLSSLLESFK